MTEFTQSGQPRRSDREAIEESIKVIKAGLARGLKWTWLEIVVLLAAICLDLSWVGTSNHSRSALAVGASVLLVIGSRANNLLRYRNIGRSR